MKKKVNELWNYMFNNLYCEKTKLFYDFIVPEHRGEFEKYLPAPELICKQIPNPCGWGSGMEDSMINAGIMLSAAVSAFEIEKDERYLLYIKNIFEGMKTCASVSESKGFLARSVSPVDGKTHYIDSSRDQYTHWIFSAAKYLSSGLATDEDVAFIKKTLCAFAQRCRENVTRDTDYNLLREDGGQGMVVKMWNVAPHEAMRLPMFFLAAWKIGGDESFAADYLSYRDNALAESEMINFSDYKRPFAINQMQLSLRFVYDYDTDAAFRNRCLALMNRVSRYGYEAAVSLAEKNSAEKDRINFTAKPWEKTPAWFAGFLSGYAYYVPMHFKSLMEYASEAAWLVRDIGDALSVYLASPDSVYTEDAMEALSKIASAIDLENHTSDAPVYLIEPYYELIKLKPSR